MLKSILVASLVLNVLLVATLVGSWVRGRATAMELMAEVTRAEVRLQEHYLAELEAVDSAQLDGVREMLRRNIENGRRIAGDWEAAAAE